MSLTRSHFHSRTRVSHRQRVDRTPFRQYVPHPCDARQRAACHWVQNGVNGYSGDQMTRLLAKAIAIVAITVGMNLPSQAAPIFWGFEGRFTIFGTDYANAGLSIGDRLFGGVIFSPSTPDLHPADNERGTYEAIFGFVAVPTLQTFWTFAGPNNTQRITVINDAGQGQGPLFDFFEIFFRNTSFDQVLPNPTRLFFLAGSAGTGLFGDDSLPLNPPAVSAFESLHFQYTDTMIVEGASATGVITHIQRLPEPSTLALLGFGLVGLAITRRRKRLSRTSAPRGF